jgi:hypothetical protein
MLNDSQGRLSEGMYYQATLFCFITQQYGNARMHRDQLSEVLGGVTKSIAAVCAARP